MDQFKDKGRDALKKFKNLMNFGEGPQSQSYTQQHQSYNQ